MRLRERSVRRGQCHCAHVKRRGPSHRRHPSCWALVRAAHPRLKMFRLARREGGYYLWSSPHLRWGNKGSAALTQPTQTLGRRTSAAESKTVELQQNSREKILCQGWRDGDMRADRGRAHKGAAQGWRQPWRHLRDSGSVESHGWCVKSSKCALTRVNPSPASIGQNPVTLATA